MSIIKFKGKRIDNGEWVFGWISEKNSVYFISWNGETAAVKPETISQYTNITDNKGKRAYFGDTIKLHGDSDFSHYDGWYLSDKEPKYIMLFSPDDLDCIPLFSFDYHADFEVIGNIYDKEKI